MSMPVNGAPERRAVASSDCHRRIGIDLSSNKQFYPRQGQDRHGVWNIRRTGQPMRLSSDRHLWKREHVPPTSC